MARINIDVWTAMKRILLPVVFLVLLISGPLSAQARINLFACEPEWGSLAREIGGDDMEIFTATTARQDPHYVRAKPSLIAAMRKADLVICTGAGLEIGWLPILLQKAGNASTQPGGAGLLLAAELTPLLEKPLSLDRAEGDIHPEGNPHLHLNPHNIALVAAALTERLKAVDAPGASAYQANFDVFSEKWRQEIQRWESEAAELNGVYVVVHHKSFAYLLEWLKMRKAVALEEKPGIPPTASHLQSLLQAQRQDPARLIIRTPYDPEDASEWLSRQTKIPALVLPYTVGGDAESGDLFALFDRTITLLKRSKGV
jgi:zinc/manganese transport system substrate-binding protein